METLHVFREFAGAYEPVGVLERADAGAAPRFAYDAGYLGSERPSPLSLRLPLRPGWANPAETRHFFGPLIPEGSLRRDFERIARAGRGDYFGVLRELGMEPIGALVLAESESIDELPRSYEPVSSSQLERFAHETAEMALDLTLKSRISLAGAQLKVGLYHTGSDPTAGWYLPRGAAPSTHIVKACAESFPNETLYEAICLKAAKRLDLEPAECFLIDAGGGQPLLAVERYDRATTGFEPDLVGGLPVPRRLHQLDMCQACGVSEELKYEPNGANYFNLMADVLQRESSDPFGDRQLLGYYLVFNYLVGNCDDHLRNWALLYSSDWAGKTLAPLYDVVPTTRYPQLSREMGVSFGGPRVIDDVRWDDVTQRLGTAGLSPVLVRGIVADLAPSLPEAIMDAAGELASGGFPQALQAGEAMVQDLLPRAERIWKKA